MIMIFFTRRSLMQIEFWGAAGTVTGSMHILEVGGKRLLLDCGLFQGRRKEAFEVNRNLPFDVSKIDAMILSHAHIDHSGNIPTLVKAGFRGKIFATDATIDLVTPMLLDSGHIQEADVMFVNKTRHAQGKRLFEPLYTREDVEHSFKHFVSVSYHKAFEPIPGVTVEFYDAGHILGSAAVVMNVYVGNQRRKIVFSGDLGRRGLPILKDPEPIPGADILIMESTYGDRFHQAAQDATEELRKVVKRTFDRKGRIVIPAFAVGRTQEVIYQLEKLWDKGQLPALDVYIDSPLAIEVTAVFQRHSECFDPEMVRMMKNHPGADPLGFKRLHYTKTKEESQRLNDINMPIIIVSASGMCEAGRVLHHLRNSLGDERNTVLMVGYQAEHTLGRKLLDGLKRVPILGIESDVRAEIVKAESYSAHADQSEMLWWVSEIQKTAPINRAFLVHGEKEAPQVLASKLKEIGVRHIDIPMRGEKYEL